MKPNLRRFRKGNILLICWQDAAARPGWLDDNEMQTVGKLLVQSVSVYVMATTKLLVTTRGMIQERDDTYEDISVVPWGCIRSIRKLGDLPRK